MTTEEGGLLHPIRTNDTPRLILRLKNNNIPHPTHIHPTRLGAHFPHGQQSMIYSHSPLLALVLVMVLAPRQEKSRTHERKEKKPSNRLPKLVSYPTHPYLHPSTPAPARALHSSPPALHLLQPQWTQQDCTSSDTATRLYLYRPLLQVPDPPSM